MALADPTVRERRLVDVLGKARTPLRIAVSERTLFGAGAGLTLAGIALIILGWAGTSRTVLVAGQIPYLVSGGLLGLGLIFLGGFLYFGYWLAMLLRDNQMRAEREAETFAELRAELKALNDTIAGLQRPVRAEPMRASRRTCQCDCSGSARG